MSSLRNTVRENLMQAGLTQQATVVLGVSGGPDSLALLHAAGQVLRPECLWVTHLNHGLRPEADAEEAFVAQTSAAHGFSFRSKKIDTDKLAREEGWTVEEAGRNARYDFLAEVASASGAEAVMVAHNRDDQAETVLHHLLRGSGLRGLQGMLANGPLPSKPTIKLLRPFLGTSRAAIEAYCAEHDLRPMIDETNRDPAYLRNRLRHELLPVLAEYNPQIQEHLGQLAQIVAADEAYLHEQSKRAFERVLSERGANWLRLDRQAWRALPLSLRRRVLRQALTALRPSLTDISFATIDQAERVGMKKETGAAVTLPAAIFLRLDYEDLLLALDMGQIPVSKPQLLEGASHDLSIPGKVELDGGWHLSAAEIDVRLEVVRDNPDPWSAYLDVGQAQVLQVRGREPGEVMQPLGMGGRSAAVQDIMVDRKLPADLRDKWPLVATEAHLVWLVGHHLDQRVKVTEKSLRVVKVSCRQRPD